MRIVMGILDDLLVLLLAALVGFGWFDLRQGMAQDFAAYRHVLNQPTASRSLDMLPRN